MHVEPEENKNTVAVAFKHQVYSLAKLITDQL